MQAEITRNWVTYEQEELYELSAATLDLQPRLDILDLSGDYKLACVDTCIVMTGPEMLNTSMMVCLRCNGEEVVTAEQR